MNHDLLCKDLFNRGFSSGASGALCAWGVDLSNNDDNELDAWLLRVGLCVWG